MIISHKGMFVDDIITETSFFFEYNERIVESNSENGIFFILLLKAKLYVIL